MTLGEQAQAEANPLLRAFYKGLLEAHRQHPELLSDLTDVPLQSREVLAPDALCLQVFIGPDAPNWTEVSLKQSLEIFGAGIALSGQMRGIKAINQLSPPSFAAYPGCPVSDKAILLEWLAFPVKD